MKESGRLKFDIDLNELLQMLLQKRFEKQDFLQILENEIIIVEFMKLCKI
jgi:hypothetical protein